MKSPDDREEGFLRQAVEGAGPATWPTDYNGFSYAGYTLQSTKNLISPVWTTSSPGPLVIGGQNVVIHTISGTQRFFRLSQ
jgi:hypothetical protein